MTQAKGPQKKKEKEIAIVEMIAEQILNGNSYNAIAQKLNKLPSIDRGKENWTATDVKRIARNPVYAGILVGGRTKKTYNPLGEYFYQEPVPPELWTTVKDPNCHYTVYDSDTFIKLQICCNKIEKKSDGVGRPPAEFGPSVLSGLLFCWYCGAPLVSGRGKEPRCFRCSRRRLKTGNPDRCNYSFTVREDEFIPVLGNIAGAVINKLSKECIVVLNEEILRAGQDFRKKIKEKEKVRFRLLDKRETLIEMATVVRKKGLDENFESYVFKAAEVEKEICDIDKDLLDLRDADAIATTPLEINDAAFFGRIDEITALFQSYSDIPRLRTAIKKFLPKIYVKIEKEDKAGYVICFRIDEIPDGLEDVLDGDHVISQRRQKIREKCTEIGSFYSEELGQNRLQIMYDNLSHTYLKDKLSYSA